MTTKYLYPYISPQFYVSKNYSAKRRKHTHYPSFCGRVHTLSPHLMVHNRQSKERKTSYSYMDKNDLTFILGPAEVFQIAGSLAFILHIRAIPLCAFWVRHTLYLNRGLST